MMGRIDVTKFQFILKEITEVILYFSNHCMLFISRHLFYLFLFFVLLLFNTTASYFLFDSFAARVSYELLVIRHYIKSSIRKQLLRGLRAVDM